MSADGFYWAKSIPAAATCDVSQLTPVATCTCLSCEVPIGRELVMSPATQPPYGASPRQREPIDRASVNTAIEVMTAWLFAFISVALIGLLP